MNDYLRGDDGHIARKAGPWARDKLAFLGEFLPAALSATTKKRDRIFLDLFAGPGLNRVKDSGEEFDGSPLRALEAIGPNKAKPTFTHGIFCNTSRAEIAALQARIDARRAVGRVRVPRIDHLCEDSNAAIGRILGELSPYSYIFAFADIEGPGDLPWVTVEALRKAHRSVDLYLLMPMEMGLNRITGMQPQHRERHAVILSSYFGDDRWRPITDQWVTDAQGPGVRRQLLDLYLANLRRMWKFADVVEVGRQEGDKLLYRMIFASDHEAGERIARGVAASRRREEGKLDL